MNYDFLHAASKPVALVAALVALALLMLLWRRYRTAVALALVAALWTWLSSAPAFAVWLQHGLVGQYPLQPATSYPRAEVIVVLGGGGPSGPGNFRTSMGRPVANTRIGFGLRLYQAGRAPLLLMSGGGGGAKLLASIARSQGLPAGAILTERRSGTTHENALYSAAILRRDHHQRILLVTSPLHMRRASASFRRQGVQVIPAPVPQITHLSAAENDWWPRRRARWLTSRCLHEYFGLWGYKLLGWA